MSSPTSTTRTIAATAVLVVALLAIAGCSSGSGSSDADRNAATYRGTQVTFVNAGNQPITVIAGGQSIGFLQRPTTVLEPGAHVVASEAGGNIFGGSVDADVFWGEPASQVLMLAMTNEPMKNTITVWHQNAPFKYFNNVPGDPLETPSNNVAVDPQPGYNGSWTKNFGDRTLIVDRNGWNDEYYLWTVTLW